MIQQQWLKQLARQLSHQGLPVSYVARCVLELRDHLDDCESLGDHVDLSMIGDPDDLADSLVYAYRRSKWLRRVPWGFWCATSLPLAIFSTLAYFVLIGQAFSLVEYFYPSIEEGEWLVSIATSFFMVGKFVPPVVASYLMLRLLGSIGRPRWVWWTSCLALTASFLFVVTELQVNSPVDVELSIDLSSQGFRSAWQFAIQTSQAIIVPVILLWSTRNSCERELELEVTITANTNQV